mmetsp:Transcript_21975/g.36369  ORF Transcript_21975/g.36369 Transcript_21975/m.36369 type:complete len:244 (+) Transcript_21975:2813-3544(+)
MLWVRYKKTANKRTSLGAHNRPYLLRLKMKRSFENVRSHGQQGLRSATTTEWWISTQEEICDNSNRPTITSFIVLASNHLRGDSVRSPNGLIVYFTEFEMLAQTKINHLQLRIGAGRGEKKVFELEITVNDSLGVQIPHCTQHLFDQSSTLSFRVMVVRLLIQSIKQLSAKAKFLDEVNFIVAFVHFFEANNVWMIKLAHYKDLLSKLHEPFRRVNKSKVKTLDRVFHASCFMGNEANKARDT